MYLEGQLMSMTRSLTSFAQDHKMGVLSKRRGWRFSFGRLEPTAPGNTICAHRTFRDMQSAEYFSSLEFYRAAWTFIHLYILYIFKFANFSNMTQPHTCWSSTVDTHVSSELHIFYPNYRNKPCCHVISGCQALIKHINSGGKIILSFKWTNIKDCKYIFSYSS